MPFFAILRNFFIVNMMVVVWIGEMHFISVIQHIYNACRLHNIRDCVYVFFVLVGMCHVISYIILINSTHFPAQMIVVCILCGKSNSSACHRVCFSNTFFFQEIHIKFNLKYRCWTILLSWPITIITTNTVVVISTCLHQNITQCKQS